MKMPGTPYTYISCKYLYIEIIQYLEQNKLTQDRQYGFRNCEQVLRISQRILNRGTMT